MMMKGIYRRTESYEVITDKPGQCIGTHNDAEASCAHCKNDEI